MGATKSAAHKPLVVVESPAKVRTIKKYLGSDYNVAATVGHIKDLPQREMGIDVEDGFTPKYTFIPGKQKVIQALKARGLRDAVKVMVGGAPVNEKFARDIGADAYAADAGDAVTVARRLLSPDV